MSKFSSTLWQNPVLNAGFPEEHLTVHAHGLQTPCLLLIGSVSSLMAAIPVNYIVLAQTIAETITLASNVHSC